VSLITSGPSEASRSQVARRGKTEIKASPKKGLHCGLEVMANGRASGPRRHQDPLEPSPSDWAKQLAGALPRKSVARQTRVTISLPTKSISNSFHVPSVPYRH
jgi:hypothetical protein